MTQIIWKQSRPEGTCKSRYKARRKQRLAVEQQEKQLARKIACALSGCSLRVLKTLRE